jgi:hypothetical protein
MTFKDIEEVGNSIEPAPDRESKICERVRQGASEYRREDAHYIEVSESSSAKAKERPTREISPTTGFSLERGLHWYQ